MAAGGPTYCCRIQHHRRGLGIEFEDTYKKYMRLGDPDHILEEATPCMAASGVDPAAARALVIKTFTPRR